MIIKQINRDAYISITKMKKEINFHEHLVTYILINGSLASSLGYTCERHHRMSQGLHVCLWDNAYVFMSSKIFEHFLLENMVCIHIWIMHTFLCHLRFLNMFSSKIWLHCLLTIHLSICKSPSIHGN